MQIIGLRQKGRGGGVYELIGVMKVNKVNRVNKVDKVIKEKNKEGE